MKKNIALLLGLTLGFTAISCSLPPARVAAAQTKDIVTMFRLYNPNSGEHFYTGNDNEKTNLVKAGWKDEGIGWIAPATSKTPVYRLYNGNSGDHHYTLNANEKDNLVRVGWTYEGIGWYSDDEKFTPLYREYNPNAVTGTHNYTKDKVEHDNLIVAGWKDEGIGWYGIDEYLNNQYYDIVEQGSYTTYGYTIFIHKVLAKEDVRADATIIAYSSDGKVIGKSTSNIELTKGEYNYFRYSFEGDVSEASFETKVSFKKSSVLAGERKAVEMVDYNVSGDYLYLTLKQTGDSIDAFAKFKLLLYNGNKIVDDEDWYFSIKAENLNGKGSTDVASIWVYGKTCDRIEYIYEP